MGQTASESVEENIFKVIESGKTAGLSFRLCEEKDLPTVMEIDGESFFDPWSLAAWHRELENPIALWIVEELGQRVIGYAGIWNVAGEAQVMRVAVKKSLRNRGLGLALTKALIQKAWEAKAEAVTLEVRESNLAAQTVYQRCGFKSCGVRPNYYEDTHEGAVIMWLYRSTEKK